MKWIKGHGKLNDHFGYWPSFHDAELVSCALSRAGADGFPGPTVDLEIHAFEITSSVAPEGHCVLGKHCVIVIRLYHVTSQSLEEFNDQNALWGVSFEDLRSHQLESVRFRVILQGSFGAEGSFDCARIEIVSLLDGTPDPAGGHGPTQGAPQGGPAA